MSHHSLLPMEIRWSKLGGNRLQLGKLRDGILDLKYKEGTLYWSLTDTSTENRRTRFYEMLNDDIDTMIRRYDPTHLSIQVKSSDLNETRVGHSVHGSTIRLIITPYYHSDIENSINKLKSELISAKSNRLTTVPKQRHNNCMSPQSSERLSIDTIGRTPVSLFEKKLTVQRKYSFSLKRSFYSGSETPPEKGSPSIQVYKRHRLESCDTMPIWSAKKVSPVAGVTQKSPNDATRKKLFQNDLDKYSSTPKCSTGVKVKDSSNILSKSFDRNSNSHGFPNVGNTCYFNSVIQVLRHVELFIIDVMVAAKSVPNEILQDNLVIRNFVSLIEMINKRETISSRTQINVLNEMRVAFCSIYPTFNNLFQHDAHEFLSAFLEELKEGFEKFGLKGGENPVIKNFQLTLSIKRRCLKCSKVTENKSEEIGLLCSIPSLRVGPHNDSGCGRSAEHRVQVHDVISAAFQQETIESLCDKCGYKTAVRQQTIHQAPRILLVILHRQDFLTSDINNKMCTEVKCSQYVSLYEHCDENTLPPQYMDENSIISYNRALSSSPSTFSRTSTSGVENILSLAGLSTTDERDKTSKPLTDITSKYRLQAEQEILKLKTPKLKRKLDLRKRELHVPHIVNPSTRSLDWSLEDAALLHESPDELLIRQLQIQHFLNENNSEDENDNLVDLTEEYMKQNRRAKKLFSSDNAVVDECELMISVCDETVPVSPVLNCSPVENIKETQLDAMLADGRYTNTTASKTPVFSSTINVQREDSGSVESRELSTRDSEQIILRRNSEQHERILQHSHTGDVLGYSYQLVGDICHIGKAAGCGHYINDSYNAKSKTWRTFNDSTVTEHKNTDFLDERTQTAYIYFYVEKMLLSDVSEALSF